MVKRKIQTGSIRHRLALMCYGIPLFLFLLVDVIKWLWSVNLSALKLKKQDQIKRDLQWGQKFGLLPATKPDKNTKPEPKNSTVLIHCASVGEVVAAIELLKALIKTQPNLNIVVTTNTLTGKQQLLRSIENTELQQRVIHNYLPVDLAGLMRRFIKHINPDLVMIMEVEMWPNFINQSVKQNKPVIMINARLTEKTCKGYQKLSWLSEPMISGLSYVFARNQMDFDNYQLLGIEDKKLELAGNIKFDIQLPSNEQIENLRTQFGINNRKVIVAGSTHDGEEQALIESYKTLTNNPDLTDVILIIAPRHPHRFESVGEWLHTQELKVIKASEGQNADENTQVVLLDQMGVLSQIYGIADVVYIGGSLVKRGGHNPIEASAFAKPVIMGQYIYNNPEIIQTIADDGGLLLINTQQQLLDALQKLLSKPEHAQEIGLKGLNTIKNNQGVINKISNKIF